MSRSRAVAGTGDILKPTSCSQCPTDSPPPRPPSAHPSPRQVSPLEAERDTSEPWALSLPGGDTPGRGQSPGQETKEELWGGGSPMAPICTITGTQGSALHTHWQPERSSLLFHLREENIP